MSASNGGRTVHVLNPVEKQIYLSAIEKARLIEEVCERFGLSVDDVSAVLDDFEQKGLILYSSDRKSFLSLAMESR